MLHEERDMQAGLQLNYFGNLPRIVFFQFASCSSSPKNKQAMRTLYQYTPKN